ncbi:MAG: hypothetical protein WCQ49_00010 [Candidatus Saccharibacteria bacterium]
MPEIINTTNPESLSQNSSEKLKHRLDALSSTIPEIAETREIIEKGSQSLIEDFGLEAEMFDDEVLSMFFTAIAQRNGLLLQQLESGPIDEEVAKGEKEFIHDAMALVGMDYSSLSNELRAIDDGATAELSDVEQREKNQKEQMIYESLTNVRLTEKIKGKINSGLLDSVKAMMKIDTDNEDQYDIRVLDVCNMQTLSAMETINGFGIIDSKLDVYVQDISKNIELYEQELGQENYNDMAPAWSEGINGKKTIFLTKILADMMVSPELFVKGSRRGNYNIAVEALKHEYVHAQGDLMPTSGTMVNLFLEEFRAGTYGNFGEYYDCKAIEYFLKTASGFSLKEFIETNPKGGGPSALFAEISNKIGLQAAMEIGLILPEAYQKKSGNNICKRTSEYIGNDMGYIRRICKSPRFKDKLDPTFAWYMGLTKEIEKPSIEKQ